MIEGVKYFLNRLFNRGAVKAQYEAARYTLDRSYVPGYVTDAKTDMNSGSRLEIMRRSRYFEKNHAVPNKILDLLETNVVGTGVNPTPLSSVPEWNIESLKRWAKWVKVADASSRQDFYTLQAIIVRAVAVDGEMFVRLVKTPEGSARLQLIESHRCVDAPIDSLKSLSGNQGLRCVDGVVIDARGRPQYYLFTDDVDETSSGTAVKAVPAEEVVHFFEPSRAGQYRGMPLFHSVLHTLHDLDDLQKYEMLAAKDASSRANVVKTENGELPNNQVIGRSLNPAASDGSLPSERIQYFEKAFGGKTVALKPNETWEQSKSERPSPAMQAFWEYLTELVCKGVGISFAAVQDYKGNWGGASLRGAVTSDNRFYEIRTRNLGAGLDRIWAFVMALEFKGETLPADWISVNWQPPRRASVDIGYDSKAVIDDLRACNRTQREIIGEGGSDWREVFEQRAQELKFQQDLEAKYSLKPGSMSCLFPNPLPPVPEAKPEKPTP